mmetsp:Transcript_35710/g.84611  ORF Transcript_35710/g.84611 Transcript_35710/m.84611 type:complete len:296 (-) Transcript_35710:42-929(-)
MLPVQLALQVRVLQVVDRPEVGLEPRDLGGVGPLPRLEALEERVELRDGGLQVHPIEAFLVMKADDPVQLPVAPHEQEGGHNGRRRGKRNASEDGEQQHGPLVGEGHGPVAGDSLGVRRSVRPDELHPFQKAEPVPLRVVGEHVRRGFRVCRCLAGLPAVRGELHPRRPHVDVPVGIPPPFPERGARERGDLPVHDRLDRLGPKGTAQTLRLRGGGRHGRQPDGVVDLGHVVARARVDVRDAPQPLHNRLLEGCRAALVPGHWRGVELSHVPWEAWTCDVVHEVFPVFFSEGLVI